MAENKTRPTKMSVTGFINGITDPARRADAKALVKIMQSAAGEKPQMWGPSIIGFGSCHFKYESGREGDMPLIACSPRKAATVLYGMTGCSDAAASLAKLGKHTTGKGCLYTKACCRLWRSNPWPQSGTRSKRSSLSPRKRACGTCGFFNSRSLGRPGALVNSAQTIILKCDGESRYS